MCYENGVKVAFAFGTSGSETTMSILVKNGDGSTCFTAEGTTSSLTYRDGADQILFTSTTGIDGETVYTCPTGQSVLLPQDCDVNSGMGTASESDKCSQGTCSL